MIPKIIKLFKLIKNLTREQMFIIAVNIAVIMFTLGVFLAIFNLIIN